MSGIASPSLRLASRLCLRQSPSTAGLLRNSMVSRVAHISTQVIPRRGYVSETKNNHAQVSVDTAITAEQKAFFAETGKKPGDVVVPGTSVEADAMMSPMAGVLKQATILDGGQRPIYLDMQATTPLDPRVLDAMLPFYSGLYGNPHSRTHAYGWETDRAIEEAREHVATLIGADPKEIIFTSGATESNNMSVKGVARFFGRSGKKNHIITSQTEHKCVLDSCRHLQDEGFEVTYLPVQKNGLVDMAELEAAMRPETSLVSIMAVNNEIGVIQPLEEIGKLCRSKKVFFHTDGAQAVGKIPVDVNKMQIDLMSISSHKIYGPKGMGACYIRRRPRVRIDPIISGGGQERGLRSGTLAPALVVGFGEACRVAKEELATDHSQYDSQRIKKLSDRLLSGLLALEHTTQNGDPKQFYPGCVNVSFAYVEGESLLMALKDIALSSGSACTSASLEPSYVLRALGSSDESAHSSIRFGIGRFTTESEIDYVLKAVKERVTFLRELSPLWELVQEGIGECHLQPNPGCDSNALDAHVSPSTSSIPSSLLPHPRSNPLRPGSAKEEAARRYVEGRLLHISRRYTKKFQEREEGETVFGYENMREVARDLGEVVDVLWLSGTASLQIPYLLNIALSFTTYLTAFPPAPGATFALLRKLDHAFSSLLKGEDVLTGERLPGFEGGRGGMSRTDMVRLVEATRVLIVEVMSKELDIEVDQASKNGDIDHDAEMEIETEAESRAGESVWNEEDEMLNMDVARVYEKTIVQLGELLGSVSDYDAGAS
ncbi:hypothetical protein B7494_g803 [Chlorociboria aeruginascens]|nr:hypothetical protein B7494_g803 [Chlorociboria aeruginascens]